jgi:phosphoglycolate phosphatase-like HAD superfamily hydrolase
MSALVFDCDGVLADTERHGHLPAFNRTFVEFGLPVEWSVEEYGRRLKIGGGKERMASLLTPEFVTAAGLPTDPDEQAAEIAKWHKRKTAIYTEMVAEGKLPPRPGIRRIISAAQDAGWKLGVASTSAEAAVHAILEYAVGAERANRFDVFLAGDCVPKKKPSSRPRFSLSKTRATAWRRRTPPGCAVSSRSTATRRRRTSARRSSSFRHSGTRTESRQPSSRTARPPGRARS